MKIANDIRALIEDDAKHLTEAFLSGEISPGETGTVSLSDHWTEEGIHRFAVSIIQYQLDNKSLAFILPFLGTMKWLSLAEACVYSRKSRNTLLELIKTGKIYGTKPEGSGDYVVDRESIDQFYFTNKHERELHLKRIGRIPV